MPGFAHLKRRPSGVYVVRFVVPLWLRHAVGQRELHRSTGCRDLALAKVVAAELVADWHARLAQLRRMDLTKVSAGSIDLLGGGFIPLAAAAQTLGATPIELAGRLLDRRVRFFVQAENWVGWHLPEGSVLHDGHDAMGQIAGLNIGPDNLKLGQGEIHTTSDVLSPYLREEAEAIIRSGQVGNICVFSYTNMPSAVFVVELPGREIALGDLLVRRADVERLRQDLVEALGGSSVLATPFVGRADDTDSIAKAKYQDRPISDLTDFYLKKRVTVLGDDEQRRQRDACSALVEMTGNKRLGAIDRDAIRDVGERLRLIPHNRHLVKRRHGELSWTDLIAVAQREGLQLISPGQVERLLEDFQSVFEWGVKQSWLRENPAKGMSGEFFKQMGGTRKPAHERRDAFDDRDLERIFGAEWFVNGVGKRTPRGVYHSYRPHYYWLPLLALYAGGRVNELSQLYLDDIQRDESGIWYIDFNLNQSDKKDLDEDDKDRVVLPRDPARDTGPDKRLKSRNAARLVPLHPALIDLGLVEYADALRAAGYQRLFPELKFDRVKGYGKAVSKWFDARYLGDRLEIVRDGRKVFHSFRHNFNTALERSGVPPKAIKQLMGHSMTLAGGESAPGYVKKREVQELTDHIKCLKPVLPPIARFNVEQGLVAVQHALDRKRTHRRPGAGVSR